MHGKEKGAMVTSRDAGERWRNESGGGRLAWMRKRVWMGAKRGIGMESDAT